MDTPALPAPHLLVACDLSPHSRALCDRASAYARAAGASVTLLHVVQTLTPPELGARVGTLVAPPDGSQEHDAAGRALAELAAGASDLDTNCRVVTSDDVAEAILTEAERAGATMVVVSTHGRRGFRRAVLGSVAEKVVRRSSLPVLCFPPQEDA